MKVINLDLQNLKTYKDEIALCLGYFDGLHLGHKALIDKAKESQYKSALLTFSLPYKRESVLTSLEDKINILKTYNLDYLFVLPFDDVLKNMSPEDFIQKVLIKLNVKEVIIGPDYSFGKNRLGNYSTLKEHDKYFKTQVVPFVYFNNQKVATSLINILLEVGKIDEVNLCLNRNYKLKAKVVKGKGNGHKFNYPTANLKLLANYKLPKNGVYKGYAYIDSQKYLAMINVGIHPSIDPLKCAIIEVHIIDENLNLYGKTMEVEFIDFIREEQEFASLQDLIKQLNQDKKKIKESESN